MNKFVCLVLSIITVVTISGCVGDNGGKVKAFDESRFILKSDGEVMDDMGNPAYLDESIIVDKQTGVNYLVLTDFKAVSVTPLYNADGSLVVTN